MALFPKTPGVYIQEISTLAPSVVPVATAVPVFIGYTEKGTKNTVMEPVRITSLIEYQQHFGGAYMEPYAATLTNSSTTVSSPTGKYSIFTSLQMFYANGGGNCYIISVGNYFDTIDVNDLTAGIAEAEKADEITLLVIPEATAIPADLATINNAMLAHCAKMQDRFAIIDVLRTAGNSFSEDADDFRSDQVGANNLKYGAAYYPPLNTVLIRPYSDLEVLVQDNRTGSGLPVFVSPYNNLFSIKNGKAAYGTINIAGAAAGKAVTIMGIQFTTGVDFAIGASNAETAHNLAVAINNNATLNGKVVASTADHVAAPAIVVVLAANSETDGSLFAFTSADFTLVPAGGPTFNNGDTLDIGIDVALYNNISSQLNANRLVMYPAATMAGIYTAVDNDRGVWKAPANVSVNLVSSVGVTLTDEDQGYLNVDATGGKSIDAIRNFTGRGILVWGARTLDGNSNEWRYVNVRRLFIMAEESCKKASEFVVFEPNDKNTWIRVKATIGNFLTGLWRDGALAGDKPEQAYFVKAGLGETMTAQDILEGKLIIQIGMAAVRPAEFIILQFEHKLQEA